MPKKKNKKKGLGLEKTLCKTEKKMAKRLGKQLTLAGEDDVKALIEKQLELSKRSDTFKEEPCDAPGARSGCTLVTHPIRDCLILFGGEFFSGRKTLVYNDLFFYKIKKNSWTQMFTTTVPPPRTSHQAVVVPSLGGQMWVFGGEFASPTQSQFYHYRDLWCLNLSEGKWEQIKAPGGPTARSGHRMILVKKKLFVFGGFYDNGSEYRYYNDLFVFDMDVYQWSVIDARGTAPSPRSGCMLSPLPEHDGFLLYGGYTRQRVKKDHDRGSPFNDMFLLTLKENVDGKQVYQWSVVNAGGSLKPSLRCGASMVSLLPGKSIMFGGVHDEDLEEECDLSSSFFDDLFILQVPKSIWHPVTPRLTTCDAPTDSASKASSSAILTAPRARMNACLAVHSNVLYIYGGLLEMDNKEVTLGDMWCLDMKKSDRWKCLKEFHLESDMIWENESSSSSDSSSSEDDSSMEEPSEN